MKPVHIKGKTQDPATDKRWNPKLAPLTLPVEHDGGSVITYWKGTFMERVKILFGAPISVCILERVQPPISLEVF